MSAPCLAPRAPTLHGRVTTSGPRPGRTRTGAAHVILWCLALLLATAGGAATWSELAGPQRPTQVGLQQRTSMGGLDVAVRRFDRRADAVAGVNTAKQPMSGRAMPMLTPQVNPPEPRGGVSSKRPETGMAGMAGGMSGMAGALKAGEERIDVDITMQNRGDEPAASLDPTQFELLTQGRPVSLKQPTKSDLSVTPLPTGYAMAGTLNVIIPQGTAPLQLRYRGEGSVIVLESPTTTPGHMPPHGGVGQH